MISVKNKAAAALHLLTAGHALLSSGITSLDAIRKEATDAGISADEIAMIEQDLAAYATRVAKAELAKRVLHERISRYLGDDNLKIGT